MKSVLRRLVHEIPVLKGKALRSANYARQSDSPIISPPTKAFAHIRPPNFSEPPTSGAPRQSAASSPTKSTRSRMTCSRPTPITGPASSPAWVAIFWASFCRTRAAFTRREDNADQADQWAFGQAPGGLAAVGRRLMSQIGLWPLWNMRKQLHF